MIKIFSLSRGTKQRFSSQLAFDFPHDSSVERVLVTIAETFAFGSCLHLESSAFQSKINRRFNLLRFRRNESEKFYD